MNKKICVIGAGISGISAASIFSEKGYEVIVYERSKSIGGLIKCSFNQENLFHRVGGHVFNSRNKNVNKWFWGHFDVDKEFFKVKRNAKILLNNQLVGYPIENNLYQLSEIYVKNIIDELMLSEYRSVTNFEEFLIQSFGKTLYEIYFEPYNKKIWGADLNSIPLDWLNGKLPMPTSKEILYNNIFRNEESSMVHSSFFYPIRGGSQFIIDRLALGLNVNKSSEIRQISISEEKILINEQNLFDGLIYTGDIRELGDLLRLNDSSLTALLLQAKELRANGTTNVLCTCDSLDFSWLYLPSEEYSCHRIINTGGFSPNNTNKNFANSCVVEFSGFYDQQTVYSEIEKLPFNLTPIEYNFEAASYVLHDSLTSKLVGDLSAALRPYKIFLLGRRAEWKYYNMDNAILSALELSDSL